MFLSLETLTPIIRTNLPILEELIDLVNSVLIFLSQNNHTQMVNFPAWIPYCDSHSPPLLDLLPSSAASISSTILCAPLGNSNHVIVSVSIDFPSNSQQDASFYHIAQDYSCDHCNGLCDHLRDVPWEDIFKLGASAAASEFCEWVQVGIDVYIPHRKNQVKPHSSPGFSAACAAPIAQRNHFFHLYQKDKSSASKKISNSLLIAAKGFLKLTDLHMLIKRKSPLLPRNLVTFGELLVFSTMVNLL